MDDANLQRAITDATDAQRAFEKASGLIPSVDDVASVRAALESSSSTSSSSSSSFVDLEFPPTAASVSPPDKADDTAASVVWRRACDFLESGRPEIFEGGGGASAISPADIRQGSLGDCWFMCSLASVAESPEKIRALFLTDEYDPKGLHRVKFFKCGCWHEVTVDDFFPCFRDRGPLFSKVRWTDYI